jgi:hypothetical protein
MSQFFKETAHTKTDMQKYSESYDHVFNRNECQCELCDMKPKRMATREEIKSLSENNPESRVICEDFGPCDL